jgi:NTE family protein
MTQPNHARALVLSGGGGRGAYHVGALRFLEEHDWYPDIIIGTSIGAVNGAAIASGHNSHSLWALWRRLTTDDVQRRAWSLFSPDEWDHLLDTSPLRKTLIDEGWIDLTRINAEAPSQHLRITVVETETGQLRVFGNSRDSVAGSRCEHVRIALDHILASCSIPVVYPPTTIDNVSFWDGGTVANTPLGPAVDAGADDIVVVLMTPWEDEAGHPRYSSVGGLKGLFLAAQAAFEWALLASFQADLKLFNRTNDIVRLTLQNRRLLAENADLRARLQGQIAPMSYAESEQVALKYREIETPVIIAPQHPIPVIDILRYELDNHVKLHRMGYEDARAAWARAGRMVEGQPGVHQVAQQ